MVAEMGEAKDIDAYYPLNVAFHARLVELSGNSRVAELYYALGKELHLFRRRGLVGGGAIVLSNHEHMQIVEALRDHNGDLTERTMTRPHSGRKSEIAGKSERTRSRRCRNQACVLVRRKSEDPRNTRECTFVDYRDPAASREGRRLRARRAKGICVL